MLAHVNHYLSGRLSWQEFNCIVPAAAGGANSPTFR
jgi:hypothetical protein